MVLTKGRSLQGAKEKLILSILGFGAGRGWRATIGLGRRRWLTTAPLGVGWGGAPFQC